MSQFDAIGRTLRARREAERKQQAQRPEQGQERRAAQERSARSGASGGGSESSAAAVRPSAEVPGRPAAPSGLGEGDQVGAGGADDAQDRVGHDRRRVLLLEWGAVVVALAVLIAALFYSPGSGGNTPGSNNAAVHPSPTSDEVQAAGWVNDHVGPDRVVACDVDLCSLVRQSGVPTASLVTVGSDITDVERADVVISTPRMRSAFGVQLTTICSPEPLALFGSGVNEVVVTAVALEGSDDYGRRLTSDRDVRRGIGAVMAHSPRITFAAPTAAAELNDGLVDSRLSSLLTLMSSSHALTVTSFSGRGPGAGADIPESDVVISSVDGQPVGESTAQSAASAAALISLVNAQLPPYRPQSAVSETGGVKISYSQPEPFGLLAGTTP